MDEQNTTRHEQQQDAEYFDMFLNENKDTFIFPQNACVHKYLNVEECQKVAQSLQQNSSSLRRIVIYGCKIEYNGWVVLARALEQFKLLEWLCLFCNRIGTTDGCQVLLLNAMQQMTSLEGLILSDNKIDDDGCIGIAKMIQKNQSIRILLLTDNKIGDNGCQALAQALKENNTLVRLFIESNSNITDNGWMYFTNVLSKNDNTTIYEIDHGRGHRYHPETTKLKFYLKLNKIGRKDFSELSKKSLLLITSNFREKELTSALYYTLRSKPDIWCQQKRGGSGRRA